MENDILDSLEDLGYSGPLLDDSCLEKALDGGPKSVEYTALVEWISKELQILYHLEEHVNAITTAEDSSSFMLELSSFLKELGCAYSQLTGGHMSERLGSRKNRMLLLDFLLTELQAARMIQVNKPDDSKTMQVELSESSTASDLKNMLIALKFPKPPANITPALLFGKVETKMKEVLAKASPELVGKPLFTGVLSDKQWHILANLQSEMYDEYRVRKELLIKRLDVTIQSFQWSDRMRGREDEIASIFLVRRKALEPEPNVHLADLLAAREDLAVIEKTSSASVRKNTQTSINKVIIGRVPDRGGRPSEQQPPPPEMPSWQQSKPGGGGRGRPVRYSSSSLRIPSGTTMGPYCWRQGNYGSVPEGAVRAGHDKDGEPIFVGRAFHEGDMLPAKVVPNKGGAFVAWGGGEHSKQEYEVLCEGDPAWVMTSGGSIPDGAVPGGTTSEGERLYIGRVMHDGAFSVGKVQPSHGVCYIPYGGEEVAYGEYEILVGR